MHAKCFASDEVKYFIFDVNKFSGGGNYSTPSSTPFSLLPS
jgi:hypothetical protein